MATQPKKRSVQAVVATKPETEQAETKPKLESVVVKKHLAQEQTGPITNVWDRIRRGFKFYTDNNIPGFENELAWFSGHTEYLNKVSVRARPYLYYIVEQLEARGMPTELALLPIIESAYQPMALSRSNAAGIWQFIPNTGGLYGLKQNTWYDGRRDIYASTRAALDLLQDLNRGFKGDWQLTLAAYNGGAGTVSRAMKKNQAQGKPTDFGSLDLPAETRSYVPRLLAVANVISRPEDFGLFLLPIPNEPYFTMVNVGSAIDLELAARLAAISPDEMAQLNPGFNRRSTDPNGPHYLLIPKEKADAFSNAVASLGEEERNPWISYQVKKGEDISNIAKNYNTTTDTIARINNIRASVLNPGDNLLIPRTKKDTSAPVMVAEAPKRSFADSIKRPSVTASVDTSHEIQAGDTLWSVAKRYNLAMQDLAAWNDLKPGDNLSVGQKLVLSATGNTTPVTALAQKAVKATLNYIVNSGDTLSAIARKFQVTIHDLISWNSLGSNVILKPGQIITLVGEAALRAGKTQ